MSTRTITTSWGLRRSFVVRRGAGISAVCKRPGVTTTTMMMYPNDHSWYVHRHKQHTTWNTAFSNVGRSLFTLPSSSNLKSTSETSSYSTINNHSNNKIKNPLTGRWITIHKSIYQSLLQSHGYINSNGQLYKIGAELYPQNPHDLTKDELPLHILHRYQLKNGGGDHSPGQSQTKNNNHKDTMEGTIVICSKPSGLLTVPGIEEHDSLVTRIHAHENYSTPHNNSDLPAYNDGSSAADKTKINNNHGATTTTTTTTMEVKACHRLDRDTSGIVILSVEEELPPKLPQPQKKKKKKNKKKKKVPTLTGFIAKQFQDRTVEKQYVSLVYGWISQETGFIERPIGKGQPLPISSSTSTSTSTSSTTNRDGDEEEEISYYRPWVLDGDDAREALTEWKVLERRQVEIMEHPLPSSLGNHDEDEHHHHTNTKNHVIRYTKVLLHPKTGRGHQLRLHMASIGHPILGDWLHAPPHVAQLTPRLCLHAETLHIDLPCSTTTTTCNGGSRSGGESSSFVSGTNHHKHPPTNDHHHHHHNHHNNNDDHYDVLSTIQRHTIVDPAPF